MESILNSVKSQLNVSIDDECFNEELIIYINATLARLNQLGVGPSYGVSIGSSEDTWSILTEDEKRLNTVKQYVYLKVRLVFDPPVVSAVLESMKRIIDELEFSIQVTVEELEKENVT